MSSIRGNPTVHPIARPVPPDVSDQVTGGVIRLLEVAALGERQRSALQAALSLKHAPHFREAYLQPALAAGYLEMTLPDQPNTPRQRYRLSAKGRQWLTNTRPGRARGPEGDK